MNCAPECKWDNRFNVDHLHGYFAYMLDTYGEEKMQKLTDLKNTTVKWDRETLQAEIDYYNIQVKQLKEEKGL